MTRLVRTDRRVIRLDMRLQIRPFRERRQTIRMIPVRAGVPFGYQRDQVDRQSFMVLPLLRSHR